MTKAMKVLIVNDDGYRGPGLHALVNALKEKYELTIVVPAMENSGTSSSITFRTPLFFNEVYVPQMDCNIWVVDGTPADCTVIALDQICKETPDLVISGINNGLNIADAVLYSGTVAAALQGAIAGIPTFALSCDFRCTDFTVSAKLFSEMLPVFLECEQNEHFFYNINFPSLPLKEIKGLKNTVLSDGRMVDSFEKRINPYGQPYYWHAYDGEKDVISCNKENSDVMALRQGYVSITPLKVDFFDNERFKKMPNYAEIFSSLKND